MVTISDFSNLHIADFSNDFARVFKESDVKKAQSLGLVTVDDVLKDTRAGSCKSMKAKLKIYPDALVYTYNYLNDPSKLPAKVDESFSTAEMFKQLLVELSELVNRVESFPFEQDITNKVEFIRGVLKVAKFRYNYNLSDFEIQEEIGCTSETCRTHHKKFVSVIASGLNNSTVKGERPFLLKFGLSDIFIGRLKSIISAYKSGNTLNWLTDMIGSTDEGTVQFFLDLLDASIYSSKNGTFKGEYIVSGFPVTKFDSECSILFDMATKEHEHVKALKAYLVKKIGKNKAIVDTLITMAENSNQFDIKEEDGLKYYQLKYEYLKNDEVRNERILFENRGEYLSFSQMRDEYNRRARMFGQTEKFGEDYNLHATDKIASQNATWHWIDDEKDVIKEPRPMLKKFVEENGGVVTFDQVKDFLKANNINIKDNTAKTYLAGFCKHKRSSNTYEVKSGSACSGRGDIAKDIINYLKSVSKPVYVSKIAKELGTSPSRIDRIVAKHPDIFEVTKEGKRVFVSLKSTYSLCPVPATKAKSRKEPLHRLYMRNMAIDILKKASGGPLQLKDVADKVRTVTAHENFRRTSVYKVFEHEIFTKGVDPKKASSKTVSLNMDVYKKMFEDGADFAEKEVVKTSSEKVAPIEFDWTKNYYDLKGAVITFTKEDSNCKKFDVSKSFDTMNDIMKEGKTSLTQESYFWLILELLHKYLTQKTTKMEREFLRDNLAFKYEPYLENYYKRMTGSELGVEGLVTRLNKLQEEGLLPERYADWSSSYTAKLINKRNRVHTARRDMDGAIKSDILQFIVLYLYTASMEMEK